MVEPNWAFWLALAVMAIGLLGTVLPGVPGVLLIYGAAVVYALVEGFATVGIPVLVVLTALAAIGATSDIWVSQTMGRAGGASGRALIAGLALGVAGMIFGFFFAGIGALAGAVIGSIAGIVLVEYRRRRDVKGAARAGAAWLIGYLVSALVEFTAGLLMIGLFFWQAGGRR
jgi:uncharacterized protein YqgC (DUF456 family)